MKKAFLALISVMTIGYLAFAESPAAPDSNPETMAKAKKNLVPSDLNNKSNTGNSEEETVAHGAGDLPENCDNCLSYTGRAAISSTGILTDTNPPSSSKPANKSDGEK